MADTEIMEKPLKAKKTRPKSGKSTNEEVPLENIGAKAKFDQLLQQAVDQTLSEAKSKKKKKKKDNASEAVLDSLRKGEGLQKEEDTTLIANTYDPFDSPKYHKSNKQKEKLKEVKDNKLKQSQVEVVDETHTKTAKKKKKKEVDEKIEDSIIAPGDKTMTISELEIHKKTPGKKKKKKEESETVLSGRSEDELKSPSDEVATPTKKPRRKKTGIEADEEGHTMSPRSEDSIGPPTEEETTSKKKKKKKPPPDKLPEKEEEQAMSPGSDLPSPKRKKTKMKKGDADADADKEHLSPDEEVTSPKGKKKKKKGGTPEGEDEQPLSPDEDATSPRARKKKKKGGEEEKDDEEKKEEEEKEVETPKKKGKKKKQDAKTEEGEAAGEGKVEEEKVIEDEGQILAITIHRTDKLKNDFFIMHPLVRVHVVDEETGKYLTKQHKERAVTAYYETKNEFLDYVLPIMTKPFDFKQRKSTLPVWEELLIFNENYHYFIQSKPKVIIFFELMDFVSMTRANADNEHSKGWHRIAWAFLKAVGNNNKINTGAKVRLQLFEVPSAVRGRNNSGLVEIYQWWKSESRKPYPSTLYVTLKGITPPDSIEPAARSMFATQAEMARMTYHDLQQSLNMSKKREPTYKIMSSWSRLAGQTCRIPNTLYMTLQAGKKGCFVVRWSHDGRCLACACHDKEGYPILLYEIPSGTLRGTLSGHFGIVYDLCWSKKDTHLLSASSDGTVRVWNLEKLTECDKLLPHPSFVYCAQFHPRVDTVVVSGGYDQVIRVWSVDDSLPHPILRQEIEDHQGHVESICFDDDGTKMYSADSVGCIMIWNSYVTEEPSRRGVIRDWTLYKKIEDPELKNTVINHITLHHSGRRLVVHSRDNVIRMFDLRIQRIMQKYIGALNFRERIRSSITPCGTFVFAGSEDNCVYAWNTDTGDQVIMYSELNYRHPVTDVHYHPRDHLVAFCSIGDNQPVLIYNYDARVAQFDAGLSPRLITPDPHSEDETPRSPKMKTEELRSKVLTKDEFHAHSVARIDRVMKTLNKVTNQMAAIPLLDLPGMTSSTSPHLTQTSLMGTTYDTGLFGSTPRSL
ncbi:hypothetical protein ACJMK2_042012, partial [Sinanodonta woodiana]